MHLHSLDIHTRRAMQGTDLIVPRLVVEANVGMLSGDGGVISQVDVYVGKGPVASAAAGRV